MPARQVTTLPQNLGVRSVQASGAVAAKMHINAALLDYRRRRGVTINSVAERLRVLTMKDLFVEADSSCFRIDTDSKKIMPVLCGGGQPDLPAHDDGGG